MSSKKDIQQKLVGSLIIEWCTQKARQEADFHFQPSFASRYERIRFSSSTLESIFLPAKAMTGYWKNGYHAFYEIHNKAGAFQVICAVSHIGLTQKKIKLYQQLLAASGMKAEGKDCAIIKTWNLNHLLDESINETDALSIFALFELPYFETELRVWLNNPFHHIRDFPDLRQSLMANTDLPEQFYIEGALKTILTNRFERNPEARKRCIAIHGTACCICGFDFGLVYGEGFTGKIEVHHKKPLSDIREEYLVDPYEDLAPVCPNCHIILHSKPDGVYTVDEVRSFLKQD